MWPITYAVIFNLPSFVHPLVIFPFRLHIT
jgi:hypothetical protein